MSSSTRDSAQADLDERRRRRADAIEDTIGAWLPDALIEGIMALVTEPERRARANWQLLHPASFMHSWMSLIVLRPPFPGFAGRSVAQVEYTRTLRFAVHNGLRQQLPIAFLSMNSYVLLDSVIPELVSQSLTVLPFDE